MAVSMIFSQATITPRSITSKLLQPSTTPTMFLPMSWTSPLTVAMSTLRARLAGRAAGGLLGFHERREVGDGLLHDAGRS